MVLDMVSLGNDTKSPGWLRFSTNLCRCHQLRQTTIPPTQQALPLPLLMTPTPTLPPLLRPTPPPLPAILRLTTEAVIPKTPVPTTPTAAVSPSSRHFVAAKIATASVPDSAQRNDAAKCCCKLVLGQKLCLFHSIPRGGNKCGLKGKKLGTSKSDIHHFALLLTIVQRLQRLVSLAKRNPKSSAQLLQFVSCPDPYCNHFLIYCNSHNQKMTWLFQDLGHSVMSLRCSMA